MLGDQHAASSSTSVSVEPPALGFVATSWILCAATLIVLPLRLYARHRRRFLGLDDLAIVFATLFGICDSAFANLAVENGYASVNTLSYRHDHSIECRKWVVLLRIFSFITLFFMRSSLCIFVLRLLSKDRLWLRRAAYSALAITFFTSLCIELTYSLQCQPFSLQWKDPTASSCNSHERIRNALTVANAFGCAVDAVCILLPLLLIYPTSLTRAQKIQLAFIFGLGIFPVACAVGKVVAVWMTTAPDLSSIEAGYFNAFEIYLGILFASAPALRLLFVKRTILSYPAPHPLHLDHDHGCAALTAHHHESLSTVSTVHMPDSPTIWTSTRHHLSHLSHLPSKLQVPAFSSHSTTATNANEKWGLSASFSPSSSSTFSLPDNTGGFASVIRSSSVVKRMDVEVELSPATPAEIAANAAMGGPLSDRDLYCSWDDPPDDDAVVGPVARSRLTPVPEDGESDKSSAKGKGKRIKSLASRNRSTKDVTSSKRPPSTPPPESGPRKVRRANIAKAEAVVAVPGCRMCDGRKIEIKEEEAERLGRVPSAPESAKVNREGWWRGGGSRSK